MALGELVDGLGVTTRVLMIAAHPDDEDTRLIAWLARGQHVETAYLSLTRGDGGQNLIGNELGEALGVIRTEELLAARRIDGAHQYFTRAYDFGFSKSAAETYTHWPHDSVLGDVVTVVRAFRPHIIIAVFSGTPADGHGHHQVSGLIAREAYDVAGDTVRFPAAKYGPAWTALKFYRDRSYFGGGANALSIQVGEYSPLLGESYSEIASRSRSQHKSQGFGQLIRKGPFTATVYREAGIGPAQGSQPEHSMFDGIDTSFARLRPLVRDARSRTALDSLPAALARVRAAFVFDSTARVLPPLARVAQLLRNVDTSAAGPDVARTIALAQGRVDRAIATASGVAIEATVAHDVATVGAPARVALTVYNRDGAGLGLDGVDADPTKRSIAPDSAYHDSVAVSESTVSSPWWLAKPRVGDLFGVPVSRVAEDQRDGARVHVALEATAPFSESVAPVERIGDPARGEVDRPLAFAPAVSVTLDQTVAYVPAKARIDRPVRVLLRSASDKEQVVRIALRVPRGLTADSASREVVLAAYGSRRVDFRVMGTLPAGDATLAATAESEGKTYTNGYIPIEYDHIRPQKLYREATIHLVAVDVRVPAGITVGYIPGVGDNVAPTLEALGIPVTVLDPAGLAATDLSKFSTVVVGTRAYEASGDLRANNRRLLDYARNGGTLVVQYGQYEMPDLVPYPITLSRPADRVTDENAPVRVLDPTAAVLNAPNKISESDWANWIQERSTYMPHTYDDKYHTVVSINDPGEAANAAGILVAPLGKGTYVYTTLAFFRQLPGGVPGAARLFVNLLAAGHTRTIQ